MSRSAAAVRGVAVLGAAASVAVAAAPVVWHAMGDTGILPPPPPRAPTVNEAPKPVDLDPVLALAPFGLAPQAERAVSAPATPPPDLTLRGIVLAGDPARSLAVIAGPDTTQSYVAGDTITPRISLTRVEAGHVVLNVDGAEELLTFPLSTLAGVQPKDPAPQEARPGGLAARIRIEPQPATDVPKTVNDYINYWRRRIQRDPHAVLDAIGLVPTEGGYLIAPEHDSGVGLAGLKAGDLVTRVNGEQVGNVDSDTALYDRIAASGQARLEIQRDGRTLTMSFPLR